MFKIIKRAPWIALGAGVAWLFDAEQGQKRRRQAKEKLDSIVGSNGHVADESVDDDRLPDPYAAGMTATGTA